MHLIRNNSEFDVEAYRFLIVLTVETNLSHYKELKRSLYLQVILRSLR